MDNNKEENNKSLAERCFESGRAENDLFKAIHEILGGRDMEECNKSGFVWPCYDCWVDDYDGSVEIVVSNPISSEQAEKILALGFSQIYESCNGEGRNWTKLGVGKCSARQPDKVRKAVFERDMLSREVERLRGVLSDAESVYHSGYIEAGWRRVKEVELERDAFGHALRECAQALGYSIDYDKLHAKCTCYAGTECNKCVEHRKKVDALTRANTQLKG